MYVFSVLILVTVVLSVFSVDEVTQGLGQLLGDVGDSTTAGQVLLMLLIVLGVLLLVGYAAWKKRAKK